MRPLQRVIRSSFAFPSQRTNVRGIVHGHCFPPSNHGPSIGPNQPQYRWYFTNGDVVKKEDPYAILGLEWGDGASSADIKAAFRKQAQLLHPDVNTEDTPAEAIAKFQRLQKAYETLMKAVSGGSDDHMDMEEWRVALWRQSDRIALDRTDVAGVLRKRPAQPASVGKSYSRELGHPSGLGVPKQGRGEYLGEGNRSTSVGTGRNKWVKPKEFVPWNPEGQSVVRASDLVQKNKGADATTKTTKK